jgi:hypothetical protein
MKVGIKAREPKQGIDKEAKRSFHQTKRDAEAERIKKQFPLGRLASFRCFWTWPFGHKYAERDRDFDYRCAGCQRTRW